MRSPETTEGNGAIAVTLMPFGQAVQTVTVEEDSTVEEILEQFGFSSYTARVNGEVAEGDNILEDGDTVVLSGGSSDKVKGGC